ncbi:Imm1 family immunity protein [Actinomadura terrae]|uniref:Imm1 family immunity protein n=1 Tax=Actinomadura terrae TaxID=604353 RepID=UPI0027DEAE0E|nr:Imm1 family immunity protein [Actinomadura terrae]
MSLPQTAKRARSCRTRRALGGGRCRRTEIGNTYDDYGMISLVDDRGDTSTTADDRCTRTTYARDDDKWLVSFASREETVAKGCGASTSRPDDVITDTRKFYDGQSWNVAPTKGDVTKTDKLDGFQDGSPRYVTVATNPSPDPYGRPTTVYDQAGRKTVNAYTPATGVVTAATVTDPANFVTRTEIDPASGLSTATVDENNKRTSLAYDPLGRLTSVWLPGRATTATPSLKFGYAVKECLPVSKVRAAVEQFCRMGTGNRPECIDWVRGHGPIWKCFVECRELVAGHLRGVDSWPGQVA